MPTKATHNFWKTANQAPAVVSLMVGFVLIFTGVLFPSVLASLVNIAGLVLVLSGIISIYILGGANRKR